VFDDPDPFALGDIPMEAQHGAGCPGLGSARRGSVATEIAGRLPGGSAQNVGC